MLSFYQVFKLMEAGSQETPEHAMLRKAREYAMKKKVGPKGSHKTMVGKKEVDIEPDQEDIDMFYNVLKAGKDPNEYLGVLWGKSRNMPDVGSFLTGKLFKHNPKEREPEAYTMTDNVGTKLSEMRDKGILGAETARIIYHKIANNMDAFRSQAFPPRDFVLTLRRLGYKEHGMDRDVADPKAFAEAIKILSKINPPVLKVSKNPVLIEVIKTDDPTDTSGDLPANRYSPLEAKMKISRTQGSELPPNLVSLIDTVNNDVSEAYKEMGRAKALGFGDMDEISGLLERIKKNVHTISKNELISSEVKQSLHSKYLDLDGRFNGIYALLSKPNLLKTARDKMKELRIAINKGEEDPSGHNTTVEAALAAAEVAVRGLLKHQSVGQHQETVQEAQKLMKDLKEADLYWMHRMSKYKKPI